MTHVVEITNTAHKIAKKLPKDVREAIVKYALALSQKPLVGQKLKGKFAFLHSYHFSYKGVAYRLIYEVSNSKKQILVRLVATRENIYSRLAQMKIKPILA